MERRYYIGGRDGFVCRNRAAENMRRTNRIVGKSSVVPHLPLSLWDRIELTILIEFLCQRWLDG